MRADSRRVEKEIDMLTKLGLASAVTLAFSFSSLLARDAHANQDFGNINAASCVPANTAIQSDLYNIGAGSVFFNSSATGLLTLYCVPPPSMAIDYAIAVASGHSSCAPDHFKVAYIDSDGTSTAVQVDAQAIRMDQSTGAITTLGTFLSSSFTSGASEVSNSNATAWTTAGFPTYIRIDMERTTTAQTAQLYSVDMYGVANCP